MSSVIQIENGNFARIHNEISEQLAKIDLNGAEFRCLWFLLRKTYGFQKKEDNISYSQFAVGTGLERRSVIRSLDALTRRNIVNRQDNGNNRPQTWGFNKYFDQWLMTDKDAKSIVLLAQTSDQLVTKTSDQLVTSFGQTGDQICTSSDQLVTSTSDRIDTRSSDQLVTHKRYKDNTKDNTKDTGADGVVVVSVLPTVTAADVYMLWQNNMPGSMTQIIADELDDLIETYTPVEVDTAIRLAVKANKRNIRYINGILRKRAAGEDKPQPTHVSQPPKQPIGVSGNLGFSLANI